MNSELRKALYKRNMVRNKFRKFGKAYWEENRIHRNNVVSIRKRSIANYLSKIVPARIKLSGLLFLRL